MNEQSPGTVFWEVTNRCNLACEHCYNMSFLNDKRFTLSREEGLKRCDLIAASGARKVVFLGGEPLADRNVFTYIERLRDARIGVAISTNGTLIDEEAARRLVDLGVELIAVSLDGGNARTNDPVRGAGTYDRIVRGLEALAQARGSERERPRIALACTLAQENYGSYTDLFELANRLGIVDLFFNKFTEVEGATLTHDTAAGFLVELDRLCDAARRAGGFYLYLPTMPRVADALSRRHGIPVTAKEESCPAVDDAVLLSDDGNVYPCSMARVEHPEYAAPLGQTLGESLEAPGIQRFVAERERQNLSVPEVCRECSYRESCAIRCALTTDQTKYHLACELLQEHGPAVFQGAEASA